MAQTNPLRYRSYYYDSETGYYHLKSRYYNPELCRFINADSVDVLDEDQNNVLENNLFAYCLNNPVNMVDDGKMSNAIDKRKCCIAAFIAVSITVSLLYLIPFENAFITFSTPEKAFHYTNSWDIDTIVSGTETSFVIASKNNVNTYKIVPKTQKGWKISSALATKDMFQYFYNGISIHIYRYKNSSDYYIALFDTDGGQINITDNRGSNFISVIQNQSADIEPVYHYYACINNMDSEYVITLNGEDIKLPITKYS